jgi:endonuclease/exonuclease/phosphatase family metal-dependent hydrolase
MLRKAAKGILVSSYFILVVIFLAASFTPSLNPSKWWWVGFTGLAYPYILLAVAIFTIVMIFYRPRMSIVGLLALLISYQDISALFAFHWPKTFRLEKKPSQFRLMTWNVRRFTPYMEDKFNPKNNNVDAIINEVNKYSPDILCFQEFYSGPAKHEMNLDRIKKECGFGYQIFSNTGSFSMKIQSGTVIFSKFPILKAYEYQLPDDISTASETPVFADILLQEDTIRVGTVHMQSYGFMGRDYVNLSKIKNQEDTGLHASRKIFMKMRNAFSQRGKQADIMRLKIEQSEHPAIVCGDLNDVPNSYAYFTVRKDMKDAFLEKGSGLGKSYFSRQSKSLAWLPTLRIDYIFADKSFTIDQFTMVSKQLSDHRGLVTDIEVPKK